MRLINTRTFEIESFTPPRIPPYAILSHTWGREGDEVSLQDFRDLQTAKTKPGFEKIEMTCHLARTNEIQYAWIDACCIDKTSSAELSESLNSMFSWYEKCEVCYAHLTDWQTDIDWADLAPLDTDEDGQGMVEGDEEDDEEEETASEKEWLDIQAESSLFAHAREDISASTDTTTNHSRDDSVQVQDTIPGASGVHISAKKPPLRWFTRGWTLQELIAPREIQFYDSDWTLRGRKSDPAIAEYLSQITGISLQILGQDSKRALRRVCLAQRISWAARRETSRLEDIAYCLLGIVQVNMPMLYGEGEKAFLRLQEEILKTSTDFSIFAWTQNPPQQQTYRGILARHPREFSRSRNCRLLDTQFKRTEEVTPTNKGLRFNVSLFTLHERNTALGVAFMDLGCLIDHRPQGILLQKLSDYYVRVLSDGWIEMSEAMRRNETHSIYIARDVDEDAEHVYNTNLAFGVKIQMECHTDSYHLKMEEAWPPTFFDTLKETFIASETNRLTAFVKFGVYKTCTDLRQIASFLLVIDYTLKSLSAYVLDVEQAKEFEAFTSSTSNMEQTTAKYALIKYFDETEKSFESEIELVDTVDGTTFQVAAKRKVKIWHTDGWLVSRKAVKVELYN